METSKVINITEKPNSFNFRMAGVGSEVKVYYDNINDLKQSISDAIEGYKFLQEQLKSLKPKEENKDGNN